MFAHYSRIQGSLLLTGVFLLAFMLARGQAFAVGATAVTMQNQDQTLFHCVAAPHVQAPPPLATNGSALGDAQPLCPAGQVPQPAARVAPKGMPQSPLQPQGVTYMYDYAYQYYTAIGASGNYTQNKPVVASSDYHSLAEIAGESPDGQQIVEIGWNVDRGVNHGDSRPHLFIYHWINGQPTCYNGCGFVQVSKTRFPGMRVKVTKTPQKYAMKYYQGSWWLGYQGEWIGYFPGSLWNNSFTQLGLTQWFGEVAVASQTPCTQMGNGILGTSPGAALIDKMQFIGGTVASASPGQTNPSYYAIGNFKGSSYNYGGPGAC